MAEAVLDRMLRDLELLGNHDLDRLNDAIRERLDTEREGQQEEEFRQALLSSGLTRTIRRRPMMLEDDTPLIEITGEPLSETIVRERR